MKKSLILLLLLLANSLWLKGQGTNQGTYTNPQFFKNGTISNTVAVGTSCDNTTVTIGFKLNKQHTAADILQLSVEFQPNLQDLSHYSITAKDAFALTSIPVTSAVVGNKIIITLGQFTVDTGTDYEIGLQVKNYAIGYQTAKVTAIENGTEVYTYTDTNGGTIEASASCLTATNDVYGVVTPGTTTTTSIYANDVSIYGTWTDPVTGAVTTYRPNGTYGPGDAPSQNPINTTTIITNDGGLTGVTLNQNGTLNIPANAPPGSYTLTYYMCSSEDNTIQCKTAEINLTIKGVDAVNDTYTGINGNTGGTTASVLGNDKYTDGSPATTANVNVSATQPLPAGFTLNADGTITVAPGTPGGLYEVFYQICDQTNTNNCDSAVATVVLEKDSDGDGVVDSADLDDDNDGILDSVENNCSTYKNVFTENFGAGTGRVTTPYTTYFFSPDYNIEDGYYAVTNTTSGNYDTWVNMGDHTGNTDGRMMVVNADYTPGEFYRRNVSLPYAPTTVKVSLYMLNVIRTGTANHILPSVRIQLRDMQGNVLGTYSSPDVPQDEAWHQITATFNNINAQYFQIVVLNDSPGGSGNDLAIDDITVDAVVCDLDNDGIPNSLDTDADGDGCFDAIEGDENVTAAQVNTSGAINTNAAGTVNSNGIATVDANGVPVLVNSGGAADVGGDQGQGIGSAANASVNACVPAVCYNDANTGAAGVPVKHGITLLKRAGTQNGGWPMNRSSAHTALESNTKGFVITRVATTAALSNITTPVEGMMVYDGEAKCLKIYVVDNTTPANTGWKCFSTPACP